MLARSQHTLYVNMLWSCRACIYKRMSKNKYVYIVKHVFAWFFFKVSVHLILLLLFLSMMPLVVTVAALYTNYSYNKSDQATVYHMQYTLRIFSIKGRFENEVIGLDSIFVICIAVSDCVCGFEEVTIGLRSWYPLLISVQNAIWF